MCSFKNAKVNWLFAPHRHHGAIPKSRVCDGSGGGGTRCWVRGDAACGVASSSTMPVTLLVVDASRLGGATLGIARGSKRVQSSAHCLADPM